MCAAAGLGNAQKNTTRDLPLTDTGHVVVMILKNQGTRACEISWWVPACSQYATFKWHRPNCRLRPFKLKVSTVLQSIRRINFPQKSRPRNGFKSNFEYPLNYHFVKSVACPGKRLPSTTYLSPNYCFVKNRLKGGLTILNLLSSKNPNCFECKFVVSLFPIPQCPWRMPVVANSDRHVKYRPNIATHEIPSLLVKLGSISSLTQASCTPVYFCCNLCQAFIDDYQCFHSL